MRRFVQIFIVLVFVLASSPGSPITPSQANESPNSSMSPAQSRLVVLETFMRPG